VLDGILHGIEAPIAPIKISQIQPGKRRAVAGFDGGAIFPFGQNQILVLLREASLDPSAPDRVDGPWEIEVAQVEAHITGTVWKIECAVGDTVEEGDTVAILESMKMEMPVEAEDSGTVAEIRCEEGQAVNEGDTLVVLE